MEVGFGEGKEEIKVSRGRESGETESFESANVVVIKIKNSVRILIYKHTNSIKRLTKVSTRAIDVDVDDDASSC